METGLVELFFFRVFVHEETGLCSSGFFYASYLFLLLELLLFIFFAICFFRVRL